MDIDTVLSSSLGLAVTMATSDGKDHPDQYSSSGNTACGPGCGPERQPSPLQSAWHSTTAEPWISTQTLANVRPEPTDSPWLQPDPDVTMVLGGKQTSLFPQSTPHHQRIGPSWQAGLQHLPTPFQLYFFFNVSFHGI